jgi:LPXTG-motif cell wall-anchored protein
VNCDPLAATGADSNLVLFLIIATALLLAGAGLLLVAHRRIRPGQAALVVVILLAAAVLVFVPTSPAQAATSDCASADNTLTVTQTSTMEDLAPGTAPAPITGLVRNNSTESTRIAAVLVEITSVTVDPGAPAGSCSADDYILVDALMPVGTTLSGSGSTAFGGASIGFNNKTINQDACKYATVHLLYTANPR